MRALDPEVNDIVWQAIEPLVPVPVASCSRPGGTDCRYRGDNGKLRATMAVERTEPSVATRAEDEKESAVPAGTLGAKVDSAFDIRSLYDGNTW